MHKRKELGYTFYRGPSLIDGAQIVGIATGFAGSSNGKTGNMIQTYMILAHIPPVEALHMGADWAICGDCKHRGTGNGKARTCYVRVETGVNMVYKAHLADKYPTITPGDLAERLRGRALRIGAYGDPAALPVGIWRTLTRHTRLHTGYTHQWRRRPALRSLVMASCDTTAEHIEAQRRGWRPFTVRPAGSALPPMSAQCPAPYQGRECINCGACNGNPHGRGAGISIEAHGGVNVMRTYQVRILPTYAAA